MPDGASQSVPPGNQPEVWRLTMATTFGRSARASTNALLSGA